MTTRIPSGFAFAAALLAGAFALPGETGAQELDATADAAARASSASMASEGTGLDGRVRALLAERLAVPPARLVLELGRMPASRSSDPDEAMVLRGSGVGGIWLVEVTDTDGERYGIQVKAGIRYARPVAARPLARGGVLTADDIEFDEAVHYGADAPPTQPLEGWEVARALKAGEPLRTPAVRPAPVIRSGRPVQVIWSSPSVRIAVDGTALSTGAAGETVTVRLETGRRVRGVARSDGTIVLEGGTR